MRRLLRAAGVALLLGLPLATNACQQKQPPAVATSSAGQEGYALDYPKHMHRVQAKLADSERESRELFGKFEAYPDAWKGEGYTTGKSIIQTASDAGRSAEYAQAAQETEQIAQFFEDEKETFQKKVGGAAQYAGKKCGCKDLGGSVVHALNKTVDETLEERLDERNEAQRQINIHEEFLGKEMAAALREQAREVSRASYLTYVSIPLAERELKRLADENTTIQATLDKAIKDWTAIGDDDGQPEETRKKAKDRVVEAKETKRLAQQQAEKATQSLEQAQQRREALQKEHDEAFKKLLAAFDAAGGEETKSASLPSRHSVARR